MLTMPLPTPPSIDARSLSSLPGGAANHPPWTVGPDVRTADKTRATQPQADATIGRSVVPAAAADDRADVVCEV